MKITLVRHGETDYNKNKLLQGFSDIPLNEAGINQAKSAAEHLKDESFTKIYSSPLSRALKTAEIINAHHNVEIECINQLKEQNFNALEGASYVDLMSKYTESDIPGAETYDELKARVREAFDDIVARSQDHNHLLITAHSRVIKSVLSFFKEDIHMIYTRLDNCSVCTLQQNETGFEVIEINRLTS